MSILYNFTILNAENKQIPVEEIIRYCFDSRENNFRRSLKKFDIDLMIEPTKIKGARFVELMSKMAKEKNITSYEPLYEKQLFLDMKESLALRESVKIKGIENLHHYRILMWNNLFSEIINQKVNIVDVLKIRIEIVSIHPDAGFPKYRFNATVTKNDERRFLTRILANVYNDVYGESSKNPIENWFNKNGGDCNSFNIQEREAQEEQIIWGFERYKGIKIKPKSKNFWKKHENSWWAPVLKGYLTEESDNKPYEVIPYDIIIHPNWFEDLDSIFGEIYDSAAHWM